MRAVNHPSGLVLFPMARDNQDQYAPSQDTTRVYAFSQIDIGGSVPDWVSLAFLNVLECFCRNLLQQRIVHSRARCWLM